MKSSLSFLFVSFIAFVFDVMWCLKNYYQTKVLKIFSPMFSSKWFIVLTLMFKSDIFWVNFCVAYGEGFSFIILHVTFHLSQPLLLKRLFSPIEWSWNPCSKFNWPLMPEIIFLDSFPLICMSILMSVPHSWFL